MNIRKNIDYSQMYQAIEDVMVGKLPQMQLYCAIGRIVCTRSEKGAAVMASEYIRDKHPEVQGFSPRNLRRMWDFCRTYENHPVSLSLAMELGWTQNVVIMEADLSMELQEWYLRAARQFGWSKTELSAKIAEQAHLVIELDIEQAACDNSNNEAGTVNSTLLNANYCSRHIRILLKQWRRRWERPEIPWHTIWPPIILRNRMAYMRC